MKSWNLERNYYLDTLKNRQKNLRERINKPSFEERLEQMIESKDHIIDKLNLTDEQKQTLKDFFKKYPNYESKVDWNKKDLTFDDFSELLNSAGKSRSQAKKYGLSGITQGKDYVIIGSGTIEYGQTYTVYKPLTHLGSVTLASRRVSPFVEGKWCVAENNDHYWKHYTQDKDCVLYFVLIDNMEGEQNGTKVAIEIAPDEFNVWSVEDSEVLNYSMPSGDMDITFKDIIDFMEPDFEGSQQFAEVMKQQLENIRKDRTADMNIKKNAIIENYNNTLTNLFNKDGTFNKEMFEPFARLYDKMNNYYYSYISKNQPVITVPANYPYEEFPQPNVKYINTIYTMMVDDWDEEELPVFQMVNYLDLSQTKIKRFTDVFPSLFPDVKTIKFPKTLEQIGQAAFATMRNITVLDLHDTSITDIEDDGFGQIYSLDSLILPPTVQNFGWNCFSSIRHLSQIIFNRTYADFMSCFIKQDFIKDVSGNYRCPSCFKGLIMQRILDPLLVFTDRKDYFWNFVKDWTRLVG